jgi:hypothetical protein
MHTVDKTQRIRPTDIWKWILETSHNLIERHRWLGIRREYLESNPASVAYSSDFSEGLIVWETNRLIEALAPKEIRMLLGVNPSQRRYICTNCTQEYKSLEPSGKLIRTAMLRPNTPESTSLHCFVCGVQNEVIRVKCPAKGCKGNVMDAIDGTCLTCHEAAYEL